jgi:FtsH-binding integral membrane protein
MSADINLDIPLQILHHAELVQAGAMRDDPLAESIKLELDFINIFIRIVTLLARQQGKKK